MSEKKKQILIELESKLNEGLEKSLQHFLFILQIVH